MFEGYKRGGYVMWAIFLLSAMSVAICLLIIIYIANKVFIAMENDRRNNKIKNKTINKKIKNEKEI